jgi:hypothetical protein
MAELVERREQGAVSTVTLQRADVAALYGGSLLANVLSSR